MASNPSKALSTDVCDLAWGPVTVRVAWTLLQCGFAVKPEVLTDARDHVMYHLDPAIPVSVAEDRAEHLTRQFVHRALGRPLTDPFIQDWDMPLSPRWRSRLNAALAPLAAWVLRLHYADGLDLERVAWRTGEDALAVEAAREGLREVIRRAAADDGVPLDAWPEARLDALLHRLACMVTEGGPPLLEVVDGQHPDWLSVCVRSSRAVALMRRGVLQRADLVPPPGGGRPVAELTLVVLHFQREARHHRLTIAREASSVRIPIGEDLLLLDGHDLAGVRELLDLAAAVGAPTRDQLRGAVLQGHGRMSRHGVVGPLAEQVDRAVRSVPWGTIEGLGELPPPLPEPPSARWAWTGVAALGAVAFLVLRAALQPLVPPVIHPLQAEATEGRGGVWVAFDVDDEANVVIVRRIDGHMEPLLDSADPSDKLRLATGDGSYRMHTRGEAIVVASVLHPVDDLEVLMARADQASDPVRALTDALRAASPGADVWTWQL